mmetsp:Transcript_121208/g.258724  ORF Transcript_121208/g.258724 Transcript_121208/m.258724 type:complete len:365 (+) Transcript_121208:73-1167(+)
MGALCSHTGAYDSDEHAAIRGAWAPADWDITEPAKSPKSSKGRGAPQSKADIPTSGLSSSAPAATAGPPTGSALSSGSSLAAEAKKAPDPKKLARIQVAEANYQMRNRWKVPKTVLVLYSECTERVVKALPRLPQTEVSFSGWTTADALRHFAALPDRLVCGLNFANGSSVGGGYKNGALAQEEDLCRRLPNLYTSLYNAKRDGLYPFGPSTCRSADRPEKYSDVLFTSGVVVARLGEDDDFKLLEPEEQVRASIVTAAAPNVNFAKEIYDLDLMYNTVRAAFIVPKLKAPATTTLILGAWGCGAFGGDPHQISELFAKALVQDSLGQLYRDVHFAIPKYEAADVNSGIFLATLKKRGVKVTEM